MRRWKTRKKTSHVLKTTRLSSLNAVINFAKSKRTSSKCQALTAKAAASSGAGGWAVKRLQCHALTNLWSYCMRQKVLFYQRIKLNKNHIKYTCNIEISNWGNRQNLSKTRVNLYTLIMTWQILYVIKYVRARRAGVDKRQIQEKWSFFNVLNTWKLFVFVHTTPLLHAFPTNRGRRVRCATALTVTWQQPLFDHHKRHNHTSTQSRWQSSMAHYKRHH